MSQHVSIWSKTMLHVCDSGHTSHTHRQPHARHDKTRVRTCVQHFAASCEELQLLWFHDFIGVAVATNQMLCQQYERYHYEIHEQSRATFAHTYTQTHTYAMSATSQHKKKLVKPHTCDDASSHTFILICTHMQYKLFSTSMEHGACAPMHTGLLHCISKGRIQQQSGV